MTVIQNFYITRAVKSKKTILITGHKGYLGSGLCDQLSQDNNIIRYVGDVRTITPHTNIDMVIHMAGPSDIYDFTDTAKTSTTIIDGTINLLNIARSNNCKFVFASTLGVKYIESTDDIYLTCKLAMENYIKSSYNNYIILRIPRVYSKCRTKGLMKQIRDMTVPSEDADTAIEFITKDQFIYQTRAILHKQNITPEYNIHNNKTIGQIKQWTLT